MSRGGVDHRVIWAFAGVYIIWGSTYLAIRFAIETIPPFLMGSVRFLLAGGCLVLWQLLRGNPWPARAHWRSASIIGALMVLGGHGAVSWAEQYVESGLAALLVAVEPLWIVLLVWLLGREKPTLAVGSGVLLGFGGVALLIGPGPLGGTEGADLAGCLAVVLGALSWAIGSLYSANAPQPKSQGMTAGLGMLCGGIWLAGAAGLAGEFSRFDPAAVSAKSLLSLLFLTVFGSLVAFSAYLWLMKNVHPARVSTYAYVNPVIAVFLGWSLASEPFGWRTAIAGAVIIVAVSLIITSRRPKRAQKLGGNSS